MDTKSLVEVLYPEGKNRTNCTRLWNREQRVDDQGLVRVRLGSPNPSAVGTPFPILSVLNLETRDGKTKIEYKTGGKRNVSL